MRNAKGWFLFLLYFLFFFFLGGKRVDFLMAANITESEVGGCVLKNPIPP